MSGWIKHLLIALALLVAALGFLLVKNWETFAMMYDNMRAMNEGAELADEIRFPEDLLDYIAEHPESVSLVAYEVGDEAGGIHFQAEQIRAAAGVPALIVLSAYARQVEAGRLDPEERIPIDSVADYALPNAGAQAHERALSLAVENDEINADSTVALRHVAAWAAQRNDSAAGDWLIERLGREALADAATQLGFEESTPPLPTSGLFLSWNRHTGQTAPDALAALPEATSEAYADTVYALSGRIARDTTFARQERQRLEARGPELTLREQRAFAKATYPRATANEYARLMEHVATAESDSGEAASLFLREQIEHQVNLDSLAVTVKAVGSKGGAMPGLLSLVGYAHPSGDGPPRVAALFIEDLPMAVFYHLAQTGMDKGFHLQLLGDDDFFEQVRATLIEG